MNNSTKISLAILLGLSTVSVAWANPPSHLQTIQWITNLDQSNADPKRNIKIENTEEITLYSGEKAYVSAVIFNNSGRNFERGYILTRPQLKQAQILNFGGQSNSFKVHDVYLPKKNYGISLVEFESSGSGQGTVEASIDLVYIQDWKLNTLHEVQSGSSEGRFNDAIGDVDCKSGWDSYAYINVLPYGLMAVETTIESDACEPKTAKSYDVKSRMIKLNIP